MTRIIENNSLTDIHLQSTLESAKNFNILGSTTKVFINAGFNTSLERH